MTESQTNELVARGEENLHIIERYLRAIQDDAPFAVLRDFFTDDVVQEEYPNRLVPNGATRGLEDLALANERGRKVVTRQTYDIISSMAMGERVAVEVLWTGTLAVPLGSIPAGGMMKARFAVWFELRDGRIRSQRNYDCFEPF